MAKLTRITGKVFGSNATATVGGIGQFGSAVTGTPNLTTDVATIQALPAYLNGWGSAVVTSRNFPPIEEVTGVLKTISYQACYSLQEGVPEYDINTEYSNTSIVKSVNNGIITFYGSLASNNIGNALSDTDYWKPVVLDLDAKANVDLANTTPAQTFKDNSIGWGMPDFTTGVSKTANTPEPYTAETNGWVTIQSTSNTVNSGYLVIDGVDVCGQGGISNAAGSWTFSTPVGKGSTYKATGNITSFVFYKCKGEA